MWTKSKRESSPTTKSCKKKKEKIEKRIKYKTQVYQKIKVKEKGTKSKRESSATTKSCKRNNGTKVDAIVGLPRPTLW